MSFKLSIILLFSILSFYCTGIFDQENLTGYENGKIIFIVGEGVEFDMVKQICIFDINNSTNYQLHGNFSYLQLWSAKISPDRKKMAIVTQPLEGIYGFALYDIESDSVIFLQGLKYQYNNGGIQWHPTGNRIYYIKIAGEDDFGKIHYYDLSKDQDNLVTNFPSRLISFINEDQLLILDYLNFPKFIVLDLDGNLIHEIKYPFLNIADVPKPLDSDEIIISGVNWRQYHSRTNQLLGLVYWNKMSNYFMSIVITNLEGTYLKYLHTFERGYISLLFGEEGKFIIAQTEKTNLQNKIVNPIYRIDSENGKFMELTGNGPISNFDYISLSDYYVNK